LQIQLISIRMVHGYVVNQVPMTNPVNWIIELVVWLMSRSQTEITIVLIGSMVSTIILFVLVITIKTHIIKEKKGKNPRTEFSSLYERVYRWLPYGKSTIEKYEEMGDTIEHIEDKIQ